MQPFDTPRNSTLVGVVFGLLWNIVQINMDLTAKAPWTIPTLETQTKPIYPWQSDLIPNAENSSMCNIVAIMLYRGRANTHWFGDGDWPVFWFAHDFTGIPFVELVGPNKTGRTFYKQTETFQFQAPSYQGFFKSYNDTFYPDSDYTIVSWNNNNNASEVPSLNTTFWNQPSFRDTTNWTYIVGGPPGFDPNPGIYTNPATDAGRLIFAHKSFRCRWRV